MKTWLLAWLLALPLLGPAQATYPRPRPAHSPAVTPPAATTVYVCGGGRAYAYHRRANCAGLNRCAHGVSAVPVCAAQGMGRRPCQKCY